MIPQKTTEKGQAIVFLVLGFVVFLGFVALAIDGGMLYSNRRKAQNASDASSLSGGGAAALTLSNSAAAGEAGSTYKDWDCNSTAIYNAIYLAENSAVNRAGSNDYTIDTVLADLNYAEAVCGVENHLSYKDKFIDVTVGISETTKASFAQMLFPGALTNVVSATTRVRPMMPFGFGNAVVALREDCPNNNTGGIHFDGNAEVKIKGGGLFSNACMVAGGNVDVDVELDPDDPPNTCIGTGCYTENGGADVDPEPLDPPADEMASYAYTLDAPTTACNNLPSYGSHTGGGTLSPGRYTQIRLNNGTLNLDPGLYCIMDDDFTVNGGELIGEGVTIYIEQGNYSSNGNAYINLSACDFPDTPPCQNSAMSKVLFYLPDSNTGTVSLLGNADSDYTGLVYAPGAVVEIGGSGSLMGQIHVQVLSDTVFIHGTADIDIVFDDALQLWKSAQIELYR